MSDEMRAREIAIKTAEKYIDLRLHNPYTSATTDLINVIQEAVDEGYRDAAREIRDALQFDLVLDERGMRVTYDAYDNLDGARIDVGDTHVSHAYAETVDRVCDQLHAAREIVRRALSGGDRT